MANGFGVPELGPFSAYVSRELEDETEEFNMVGNYDRAAKISINGVDGKIITIQRLMINMAIDDGDFSPFGYGRSVPLDDATAVKVRLFKENYAVNLTAYPVYSHADWAALMYDWRYHKVAGSTLAVGRWTFSKMIDGGLKLESAAERFEISMRGDFTQLHRHQFIAQGHVADIQSDTGNDIQDVRIVGGTVEIDHGTLLDVNLVSSDIDLGTDLPATVDVNVTNPALTVTSVDQSRGSRRVKF